MKILNYKLILPLFVAVALTGCVGEDLSEHHIDNKVYVSSGKVCDDLLIKKGVTELSREIEVKTALPAEQDIEVTFDAVPMLCIDYNLIYNDNATVLDPECYEIPQKTTLVKAGAITGDKVVVNFKNLDKLDATRRYVLPVAVTNITNIDLLESSCNVYFVFKGGSLIDVVAGISNIYFEVKWTNPNLVRRIDVITVEALVYSDDWTGGRKDNSLNSLFGVEGHFLVRLGDAGREPNDLQVVTPATSESNFPPNNVAPVVPVGVWTHIAIVYNTYTHKRIYYQNGKKVYEDDKADTPVNLISNTIYGNEHKCFVGRSWDDNRWFAGCVSELRVWTVERKADELMKYAYELNTEDSDTNGLLCYWKFNEGTGKIVRDYSENGCNLEAEKGSPVWTPVALPQKKEK